MASDGIEREKGGIASFGHGDRPGQRAALGIESKQIDSMRQAGTGGYIDQELVRAKQLDREEKTADDQAAFLSRSGVVVVNSVEGGGRDLSCRSLSRVS